MTDGWPWWFNYLRVGLALFLVAGMIVFWRLDKRRRALEEELRFKREQIRRDRWK